MEIYIPLVAVIIGALTPVIVGLYVARREREEQQPSLVPLRQGEADTGDHYRHGSRWSSP
jgi:hypothetical protein